LSTLILFQIVVGVTKAISDRMSKGGIADRMIAFNGFPFLDNKEDHSFGVPVSQAMTTNVTSIPASGLEFDDVQRILSENKFQGYPIVEDHGSKTLIGYIGRTELIYAISRVQRESRIAKTARCYFTPASTRSSVTPASGIAPAVTFDTMPATAGQMSVDFSRFIDATPLAVHPRLPLETVMELFKKMGPRVILIEYRGKLTGLVTVKDCLKYQFKVEAQENPKDDDTAIEDGNERIWELMNKVGGWLGRKKPAWARGEIRVGEARNEQGSSGSDLDAPYLRQRSGTGTSQEVGLELEDR
jgi:chloride channel 3/4/5